jgi:hypothetical protein
MFPSRIYFGFWEAWELAIAAHTCLACDDCTCVLSALQVMLPCFVLYTSNTLFAKATVQQSFQPLHDKHLEISCRFLKSQYQQCICAKHIESQTQEDEKQKHAPPILSLHMYLTSPLESPPHWFFHILIAPCSCIISNSGCEQAHTALRAIRSSLAERSACSLARPALLFRSLAATPDSACTPPPPLLWESNWCFHTLL